MNRYPLWQYLLLLAFLIVGVLYALPNLYGQQPAVQISGTEGKAVSTALLPRVKNSLQAQDIDFSGVDENDGKLLVRFTQNEMQLKAAEALKRSLGNDFIVAPALAPQTPKWLRAINARPMSLGLDLRGGVHFLIQVDMQTVYKNAYKRYSRNVPQYLREHSMGYTRIWPTDDGLQLEFANSQQQDKALDALKSEFSTLQFQPKPGSADEVVGTLTLQEKQRLNDFSVSKNITTLRNRVNELGVSEAIVQRQGDSRIVVELPGVQDTTEAKRLLGKTATLQYRLVAQGHDPYLAAKSGNIPPGTDLFRTKDGNPILLVEDVIASGDQLVDATVGRDQRTSQPIVNVTLGGAAADKMLKTTANHVGDPMAVLFVENKVETHYKNGKEVRTRKTVKKVISVATIQGVFGSRFQTSGLTKTEAHDLALLLRAGALAAPVEIVSERTIGPSLGAENIKMGKIAVSVGFLLVIGFMALYYGVMGIIADLALLMNLVLLIAAMSLIQATLTLPGIAGIVLTLGMAVDANVLIFERIREELHAGASAKSALARGYERALPSIADGQLTTLIAGVVLFAFGTGPIKGFAVTLSIGILTSLYTSVIGARALTNLYYGRRKRLQSIHIG